MESESSPPTDFLDFLGPDTSATVFTMLQDPADLARVSPPSRAPGETSENDLQSFKLPRLVLCIRGVLKVELLRRVQKQVMDGLHYICVSHVQIVRKPLS